MVLNHLIELVKSFLEQTWKLWAQVYIEMQLVEEGYKNPEVKQKAEGFPDFSSKPMNSTDFYFFHSRKLFWMCQTSYRTIELVSWPAIIIFSASMPIVQSN